MAVAKYRSTCEVCRGEIAKGEQIEFVRGDDRWRPAHVRCAPPVERPAEVSLDVKPIYDLLTSAKASGLRWPKIAVVVDGVSLAFSIAGERSKYCGSVMVSETARFGRGEWYGAIAPDGTYSPTIRTTPETVAAIMKFAADPVGCANVHALMTGCCCFCGSRLTDQERSTRLGYGPVCAKRWNLPWSSKAADAKVSSQELAEMENAIRQVAFANEA